MELLRLELECVEPFYRRFCFQDVPQQRFLTAEGHGVLKIGWPVTAQTAEGWGGEGNSDLSVAVSLMRFHGKVSWRRSLCALFSLIFQCNLYCREDLTSCLREKWGWNAARLIPLSGAGWACLQCSVGRRITHHPLHETVNWASFRSRGLSYSTLITVSIWPAGAWYTQESRCNLRVHSHPDSVAQGYINTLHPIAHR